ncbi:MAG: hypothetical protein HC830_07985 [Bacteroidetes bacterium]|nr:hypothetical protein [Bacteroidota bacterium]
MKKLMKILAFFLSLAILPCCSESFIEQLPQGVKSENLFYNEKGINSLLTGTYSLVRGGGLWEVTWGASVQNWTYGSVASDDAYKGSEDGDAINWINEIERWSVTDENGYVADKWKLCIGMGVNRANITLDIIKKTKNIPDEKIKEFTAEARFLRAFLF